MENLFKNMGLSQNVLKSIEKLGYTTPSEIQSLLIPAILEDHDALGEAQTGTGKTLAFAAGILSKLDKRKKGVKAIILSPTRELALQISKEFDMLDIDRKFNTVAVYGGSDIRKQISILRNNPDIVIGTPGRVKDLIERKKLNLTVIDYFVLDEADEMLNMGFIKDIEMILSKTARDKKVLMLSATMPNQIKDLAENYMRSGFKHLKAKATSRTADNIVQSYVVVTSKVKQEALCRIIDSKNISKSLIFVKTKRDCDELAEELENKGYSVGVLHGDISQGTRIRTLERFKKHEFKYLIATDVAARGIHVNGIELVINYHIPFDKESYIHRIGRTGRAQSSGEAISLITSKERDFMKRVEKHVNSKINEINIPGKKEILEVKYSEMLKNANDLVEIDELNDEMAYIRDLNKTDLMKLSAALLKYNVTKEIGSDLNKEINVKERQVRSVDENKKRIFINVGKKDRIRKNEFLDFVVEESGMGLNQFSNLEILETFSFIDINSEMAEKFIKKINGTDVNGRTVNAEISTKKSKSSGGRNRNFGGRDRNSSSRDRNSSRRDNNRDGKNFNKRK